jgi:hypothetical protein
MMITDPLARGLLGPPKWVEYAVMAFFVVFVCGLSKRLLIRHRAAMSLEQPAATDGAA